MSKAGLWFKMLFGGTVMCVGGPALVYYVSPTSEELFERFNPELQKRSLENREQKQKDVNEFLSKLKEYSKSDKPIWVVAAEEDARAKANMAEEQRRVAAEIQERRDEIKRHSTSKQ